VSGGNNNGQNNSTYSSVLRDATAEAKNAAADLIEHKTSVAMDPLYVSTWSHILSFVCLADSMMLCGVNQALQQHVKEYWQEEAQRLNLNFFFYSDFQHPETFKFVKQFRALAEVNLAFCSKLTDASLVALLDTVLYKENVRKLNLYFCYELSDEAILYIVQTFPKLTHICLGKCVKLTDESMRHLSTLRQLKNVDLSGVRKLTNQALMTFDYELQFPKLKRCTIIDCANISEENLEETKEARPSIRFVTSAASI
jgi:hypothetical protein